MKKQTSNLALFAMLMLAISTQAFAADISVKDAYVRAVPPGQTNSAAFMTFHNNTAVDKTLIEAESSVSDVAEVHEHKHEDGMMKMRRVEGGLKIEAHGMKTLQPGGLHIMLIGLKQKLVPGEMVHLKLKFDDGTTQDVQAEIRKIAMKMKKDSKMDMKKHSMH